MAATTEYDYRDWQGKMRLVVMRGTPFFASDKTRVYVNRVRKATAKKPEKYDVHYGLQRWDNLDYADAARRLGEALMHATLCDKVQD